MIETYLRTIRGQQYETMLQTAYFARMDAQMERIAAEQAARAASRPSVREQFAARMAARGSR